MQKITVFIPPLCGCTISGPWRAQKSRIVSKIRGQRDLGVVRDPVRYSSWVHSGICFQEGQGSATKKIAWVLVTRFHLQCSWGLLFKKHVSQEKSMAERPVIMMTAVVTAMRETVRSSTTFPIKSLFLLAIILLSPPLPIFIAAVDLRGL